MKTATSGLVTYLNAVRGLYDAPLSTADCFIVTAATGVVMTWTNVDYPVAYNGRAFSCRGPLVQGLKFKSTVGVEVDKQQVSISARPTDLVSGVSVLAAIRDGAFDGATIERHRVFLAAPAGEVIGGVMLFHGRIATVDMVGRTRAQITVASDLIILDYDMPRNMYQSTCLHVLYDSGCGVLRSAYSADGAVASGSTASLINWAGSAAPHAQGSIVFTSGVNANVRATIRSASPGAALTLMYPLPSTPSPGDAFSSSYGCDHTPNTCVARFSNLANFRGFPYVPPPQIAY